MYGRVIYRVFFLQSAAFLHSCISVTVNRYFHWSYSRALWDFVCAFFSYPLFIKVHHHGQFTDKYENKKRFFLCPLVFFSHFSPLVYFSSFFQQSLLQQEHFQTNMARQRNRERDKKREGSYLLSSCSSSLSLCAAMCVYPDAHVL